MSFFPCFFPVDNQLVNPSIQVVSSRITPPPPPVSPSPVNAGRGHEESPSSTLQPNIWRKRSRQNQRPSESDPSNARSNVRVGHNAGPVLVQRRRRCPSTGPALCRAPLLYWHCAHSIVGNLFDRADSGTRVFYLSKRDRVIILLRNLPCENGATCFGLFSTGAHVSTSKENIGNHVDFPNANGYAQYCSRHFGMIQNTCVMYSWYDSQPFEFEEIVWLFQLPARTHSDEQLSTYNYVQYGVLCLVQYGYFCILHDILWHHLKIIELRYIAIV